MLSKPHYGWSDVTIGDFKTQASDLDDIPFTWLQACKSGLEHNIPVSLFVEEEGSDSIIVSYYYSTHVIIEDEDLNRSLKTFEDIDFMDITYMLLNDIKEYFEDWVKWFVYEDTEKDFERRRKELKQLIDETEDLLYSRAHEHNKPYAKY